MKEYNGYLYKHVVILLLFRDIFIRLDIQIPNWYYYFYIYIILIWFVMLKRDNRKVISKMIDINEPKLNSYMIEVLQ